MSIVSQTATVKKQAQSFLMEIWGDAPGNASLSYKLGKTWNNLWLQNKSPQGRACEGAEQAAKLTARGADVYYSVCLGDAQKAAKRGGRRFSQEDIVAVPYIFADIDQHAEGHHSNGNQSPIEVWRESVFPELPPTLLISSGGGHHAYWKLKKPFIIKTPEQRKLIGTVLQGFTKALETKSGYKIDHCTELARVLRIPGTLNHKNPKAVKTVQIVDRNAKSYTLEEIMEFSKGAASGSMEEIPETAPPAKPPAEKTDGTSQAGEGEGLSTAEIIAMVRRKLNRNPDAKAKFEQIFAGNITEYNFDFSNAVQALSNIVVPRVDGDFPAFVEVVKASALWDHIQATRGKRAGGAEAWLKLSYNKTLQDSKQKPKETSSGLLAYSLNDRGNAQRLKAVHGDVLRFVENLGWITWNGKHWLPPYPEKYPARIMELAGKVMNRAKQEAAAASDEQLMKFFSRAENAGSLRNTLEIARGLMLIDSDKLDSNPWLLNTQNGLLELTTGELAPHNKEALCTRITGAEYKKGCHSFSLWEETLAEVLPDPEVREYFQRWAGYCLTGSTQEEKVLFLFGRGGSGKGTLCETIQKALGSYSEIFDTELFLQSRNDGRGGGQAPTPELAKLQGARFALGAETEHGRKLSAARLKNLTGGDFVTARLLHQNPISFRPQCKFIMQTNYMPRLRDATDEGLRRRIFVIKFDAPIKPDRTRKAALQTDEELAACLSWCVEGFHKWRARGLDEDIPEAVRIETRQFFEKSDQIQEFLDSCCKRTEKGGVSVSVLLNAYNHFAGKYNAALSRADFVELMERRGHLKQKLNWGAFRGKYGFPHLELLADEFTIEV